MKRKLAQFKLKYEHKTWYQFVKELLQRSKNDGVSEIGAQLAYYLILSIFPFIIFFLSILKFTPLADANVLQRLLSPLPGDSKTLFYNLISNIIRGGNIGLLSFGAIGSIWSSSNGIMSVIKAVNRAYDLEENRPYLKLRMLSVIFTLYLFVVLAVAISLIMLGEELFKTLFVSPSWSTVMLWQVLTFLVPLFFVVFSITLLYKYSPSVKKGINITFSESVPGAIFSSIAWFVLSIAFSYYVSNFGNYSKTYGSLGGVIVFLLWLYMSSIVIVLGAEVNATLLTLKASKAKLG